MLSIPELATQLTEKTLTQLNEDNSHTLILVGSPSTGKTTILNSFLDKTDPPRETLVLEYTFGRKTNQKQGLEKTICNIWEYGGKLDMIKNILPYIPLKGKCYYCLMIDLSKIKCLWNTIDTCIEAMNKSYEASSLPELVLICGKYDLFKNYDADIRKTICITLRSVALLLNAHLLFYSSKDTQLIKRVKDLLHHLGFGSNLTSKDRNVNFMKPLNIPKGVDSWDSIGVPPSKFEQIKMRHLSRIPLDAGIATNDTTAPSHRTHPEPLLDFKVSSHYKELQNSETLDIALDDYIFSL